MKEITPEIFPIWSIRSLIRDANHFFGLAEVLGGSMVNDAIWHRIYEGLK